MSQATEPQTDAPKPDKSAEDFARQAEMTQPGLIAEFWDFLKHRKKWWLAPILIMLVLLSFLIIFTEGSALAPFIYAIF